ncbi:TIR domain-containing protein [Nocardia salmonicida]|uniref:TIR domain-containing protein n=1 Tax=Nocardia salmonicida TaxID=53431 RepID=UPI00365127C3
MPGAQAPRPSAGGWFTRWRIRRRLRRAAHGSDVFISYSDKPNSGVAEAIQRGLNRLNKRWGQPRALRVFLDTSNLTASPDLWSELERALASSRYFLLLASPAAAASPWVRKEVEYWQRHKDRDKLLIGLVDGDIVWEEGDFAWARSNALPVSLSGYFGGIEPKWVDLRSSGPATLADPQFKDRIATLAAPIHGISKDELVSEDLRAHRIARRIRAAAVSALVVLLIIAVGTAATAFVQRNEARDQARVSLSRQLASTADSLRERNLRAALQLAVSAYRTDQNPQTLSALMRVNLTSPKLIRYLSADTTVTEVVGSADGTTVVAGLADGSVVRWHTGESRPATLVGRLDAPAISLVVNADGSVIAATDKSTAMLWQTNGPSFQLTVPAGQDPRAVGVSPTGDTAVVQARGAMLAADNSVTVHGVRSRTSTAHRDPLATNDLNSTTTIVVISDDEMLLFDDAYGGWDRRAIVNWTSSTTSSVYTGTRQRPGLPSADGRFITVTNGVPTIPVWATDVALSDQSDALYGARFSAQAPNIDPPGPLALSPDGSRLAIATGTSIYVTPVAPADAARDPAIEVVGATAVQNLAFIGDNEHLISVSDRHIALWDVGQIDRLATTITTPLGIACRACDGAAIALAPDAEHLTIAPTGSSSGTVIVQPMAGVSGQTQIYKNIPGVPLWTKDGRLVALASRQRPTKTTAVPVLTTETSNPIVAATTWSDQRTAIAVDAKGGVHAVDLTSGTARVVAAARREFAAENTHLEARSVAFSEEGDLLAMVLPGADTAQQVAIIDTSTGAVVGTLPPSEVSSIAFAGPYLLRARGKQPVEVWNKRGTGLPHTLPAMFRVVGDSQGTLVAESLTTSVNIADLTTGTTLATLIVPSVDSLAYHRTSVVFAKDNATVITVTTGNSANAPGFVVERRLDPRHLVDTACASAGAPLTDAEYTAITGLATASTPTCPH